MSKRDKSSFDELREEVEVRLGGILGEMGAALTDALSKIDAQGSGDVQHEVTFDSGKGPVRASAGIRIRPLGGSAAKTKSDASRDPSKPVNTSGSTPKTQHTKPAEPQTANASQSKPRSIAATIFENDGVWTLVAELPGISLEDVSLSIMDNALSIEAKSSSRHYFGSFALPENISLEDIRTTVQNGILQLAANRSTGSE